MAQTYLRLPKLTPQDTQRFLSKVDKRGPDECWLWAAGMDWDGYGVFRVNYPKRSCYRAHRIAYMLHYGEDPWPLLVRHLICDNPKCCNPAHLAKGSILENNQDAVAKGRTAKGNKNGTHTHPEMVARGESSRFSKLTETQVLAIRELYPSIRNYTRIGKMFGIHKTNVKNIVARRTWTHI